MDSFELLPDERIVDVALLLPINNITAFCLTSRIFNEAI